MDVKSVFLNADIGEDVYVTRPKGIEDPYHLDYVYKLKKALLFKISSEGMVWKASHLLDYEFTCGHVDKMLFIKKIDQHIFITQIYVDDIVLIWIHFGKDSSRIFHIWWAPHLRRG